MAKKPSKKILLIEDDSTQSMMYELEFKKFGYNILLVDNGQDGMKKIAEEKPDLVLLDLLLGATSGIDVLKSIKSDQKTKDAKVVIMTNYKKKGLFEECTNLGAIDFWTKCEYTPKEIVEKVDALLK